MTIMNGWVPPDGYPEKTEYYETFFYNKVLADAPRDRKFEFHKLYKTFGYEWNSLEQKWLNVVTQEIRIRLINDDYIKQELQGGTEYRLTEKARGKRDEQTEINQTPPSENTVSTKALNSILETIETFELPAISISQSLRIKVEEVQLALNVLKYNGYVTMSKSKGVHDGKEYKIKYYVITTLGKEVLDNGGLKQTLSMKTPSKKRIVKHEYNNKFTEVQQVIQGSSFENNTQSSNMQAAPIKNEPISKWQSFVKFISNPLVIKIGSCLIVAAMAYFGYEFLGK